MSLLFLGNVISKNGIMVDPKKIEGFYGWARPTSSIGIHSFIGLGRY